MGRTPPVVPLLREEKGNPEQKELQGCWARQEQNTCLVVTGRERPASCSMQALLPGSCRLEGKQRPSGSELFGP